MNSPVAFWLFSASCGYLYAGSLRGAVWGLAVGTGLSLAAKFYDLYTS
jgi:hypothetical protein